jgi:trk system potassium uptake protein TrkA
MSSHIGNGRFAASFQRTQTTGDASVKIILVGGGRVIYFLSRRFLSKQHAVIVINRDAEECRWMARQLDVTVVHGDGSFPQVLDEAGAHDADAVLALTPSDADNLVICQIAERYFQVPATLAVVSDPDHEALFPKLGIKNVISITRFVATLIEGRTEAEEITNLVSMGEGKVNVIELNLSDDCPVLGQPLADIPMPDSSLIACILRADQTIVPYGATTLMAGDRVVLISAPECREQALNVLTGES